MPVQPLKNNLAPPQTWPDPLGDPMYVKSPGLLWSYTEISQAIKGRWLSDPDPSSVMTGVTYLFRRIRSGDLVFQQNNAHWSGRFKVRPARSYFDAGASALITSDATHLPEPGMNVYKVDNTFKALLQLGRYARRRFTGTVMAITGSAGKSTTKEMVRSMLGRKFPTVASRGNFNHCQGVALSLAQTPPSMACAIYEVGVGNPKRTARRVGMVCPDFALITDIFYDHLKYYDTIEAYADQKSMIFDTLKAGGVAMLNRDSAFYDRLAMNLVQRNISNVLTFGEHAEADIKLLSYELNEWGSEVNVGDGDGAFTFKVSVPGRHMVINAVAALTMIKSSGLDWREFAPYLVDYQPINQRTERFNVALNEDESFVFIDDCFSANSGSMQAGLDMLTLLNVVEPSKKILVLGEMLSLGKFSPSQHEALLPFIMKQSQCLIYLFGKEMRSLYDLVPKSCHHIVYSVDLESLESEIFDRIGKDDLVYLKASDPDDAYLPFIARLKALRKALG